MTGPIFLIENRSNSLDSSNRWRADSYVEDELGWYVDELSAQKMCDAENAHLITEWQQHCVSIDRSNQAAATARTNTVARRKALRAAGFDEPEPRAAKQKPVPTFDDWYQAQEYRGRYFPIPVQPGKAL